MNEEYPTGKLNNVISSACHGLLDDFTRLRGLLVAPNPELESPVLAMNLMEFGRGQISGVEQPSDSEREFMEEYIGTIDVHGEIAQQFCAYLSGCVLAWVSAGELGQDDLEPALEIVQARSIELFPEAG